MENIIDNIADGDMNATGTLEDQSNNIVANLIDVKTDTAIPTLDFDVVSNKDLLQKCYSAFQLERAIYTKIYWYYCGLTDTNFHQEASLGGFANGLVDDFVEGDNVGNYAYINDRGNEKINTNFLKRLISEEVSYSVANPITYQSISGDNKIIDALKTNEAHWSEKHESELAKNMLLYSTAYELYYLDNQARFCAKVVSPRHGFAYCDNFGNVILFFHIFRNKFDSRIFIDIYSDNEIIHCNQDFDVIGRQPHYFNGVPISICKTSEEGWLNSIYHDIKSLQDSYETNISDISSEITNGLANCYLHLNNIALKDGDLAKIKKLGIIETKGTDVSAQFLTKNINDSFIQSTLTTIEDKIFYLTSHINPNEKLPSNTSSLSIRLRMMGLETKCKINEASLSDCLKTRHQMLFDYINSVKGTKYNYLDIKSSFSPNLPTDDLMTANILALLNGKITNETGIAQISFISDPAKEDKAVKEQDKANSVGQSLLDGVTPPTNKPVIPSLNKTA